MPGGCTCQNEVVVVNGNINVNSDNSLVLQNCTIYINGATSGQYAFVADGTAGTVQLTDSIIQPGPDNTSARFNFSVQGTTFQMSGSTIIGAGTYSSPIENSGVYVATPSGTPKSLITNSVIKNGYNGLVLAALLPGGPPTIVNNLTSTGNTMRGVYVVASDDILINASNISYNGFTGIDTVLAHNLSVNYTYVWGNGYRGISYVPSGTPQVMQFYYNDIRNNSEVGVYTSPTLAQIPSIWGNKVCWNGAGIVLNWGGGGAPPMNNTFCVNITSPSQNGLVRPQITQFNYTVSNNPTGQRPAGLGNTACTVYFNNSNITYAFLPAVNASAPETFGFVPLPMADGVWSMKVECDPYNNVAISDARLFTSDFTAPKWGSSTSTQGQCAQVNLSVLWQDSTTNVSWVWLSTNETGSFRNYSGTYGSPMYLGNQTGWTNFTWWNESKRGQQVYWRAWANDSLGNTNGTQIANFTAIPCMNPAPITGGVCSNLKLSVQWLNGAYNLSSIFLSTNETTAFANYTNYPSYNSPQNISQGANWTNFTWWNSSMANQLIAWRVFYNYTFGVRNSSNASTFTAIPCATPAPLTISVCGNVTLAVQWSGGTNNLSMAYVSTNETGTFANYTSYPSYSSPQNVTDGTLWTNFTWWNASLANQVVAWNVWYNDTLGAFNSSNTTTFTAVPCAAPSVITAVPTTSAFVGQAVQTCSVNSLSTGSNFVFQPAAVNGIASCSAGGAINYISIRFASNTNLPTTLTTEEVSPPSDVPLPSLATYTWINVTKTLPDEAIGKTVIRFTVTATWLAANKVDPARVVLYRWSTDTRSWSSINTTIVSTDNVTLYEASLPGFSLFAIGGPAACPACPEPGAYGECAGGKQNRTEYTCGADTAFNCKNMTSIRSCGCPACPKVSVGSCVNGTRTRTTYSCSESTNFECVQAEKAETCTAPGRRLLPQLPLGAVPEEDRPLVDMAIIGVVVVAVGAGLSFLIRPHLKPHPHPQQHPKPHTQPRPQPRAQPHQPQKPQPHPKPQPRTRKRR